MVESQVVSVTPATHADNHRTGGTDPLTGAVGINAMAPAAHKATHEDGGADVIPGVDYTVTASDVNIHANDTARSCTATVLECVKEIELVRISGELRIEFELFSPSIIVDGRIYRNGVAVGVLQQHNGASTWSAVKTEDIAGWSAGDLMQLYCKIASAGTMQCRNLRIDGTIVISEIGTNQDP